MTERNRHSRLRARRAEIARAGDVLSVLQSVYGEKWSPNYSPGNATSINSEALLLGFRSDHPDVLRVISTFPPPLAAHFAAYVVFPTGEGTNHGFIRVYGRSLPTFAPELFQKADKKIPASEAAIQYTAIYALKQLDKQFNSNPTKDLQTQKEAVLLAYLTAAQSAPVKLWELTPEQDSLQMKFLQERNLLPYLQGRKYVPKVSLSAQSYSTTIDVARLKSRYEIPVNDRSPEETVAAQVYELLTEPRKEEQPATRPLSRQAVTNMPVYSVVSEQATAPVVDTPQSNFPLIQAVVAAAGAIDQARIAPAGSSSVIGLTNAKYAALLRFLMAVDRNPEEGSYALREGQYGKQVVISDSAGASVSIEIKPSELQKMAKFAKRGKVNTAVEILRILDL